ncbi:MAG: ATP-binding protein [Candidatus Pacebacteria bacterium]|nr:ATP-binding protein [Candidatus Paceibacterota bacterium]MDD3808489.1 ATP-binding protein [Candidatus Paceibacterota bacterium]
MNQKLLDIVKRQKISRDDFLSRKYLPRTQLKEKNELLKPSLIKIITGPRRAGKSIFLLLLLKGIDFMYANFDDEELLSSIDSKEEFLDALQLAYGPIKTILLDEIQNLSNWDLFLNKLQRYGYNVFVTGSNSNLLSSEFASSLTGRYRTLEILPFSYKESLEILNIGSDDNTQKSFAVEPLLKYGGFPEILINKTDPETFLSNLIFSIIYKDITKRYSIREPKKIELLISYLISNTCQNLSHSKISFVTRIKNYRTVDKYLDFVENSYLFFFLSRFDNKPTARLASNKKIYVIDNGFLSYKNLFVSPNSGVYLENLVFTELIKKGFSANSNLFYYKTKSNKEVDFAIKGDQKGITHLIQVCFDISNEQTEKREVNALIEASNELNCNDLMIITMYEDKGKIIDNKKIQFVPF